MTDSTLSLLKDGEICVAIIDGKRHEALWHAHDRHFVVIPEGITEGTCQCYSVDQIEEWWSVRVKF